MDGLARAAGGSNTFRLPKVKWDTAKYDETGKILSAETETGPDGKPVFQTYEMGGLVSSDFADVEAHILEQRVPVNGVLNGVLAGLTNPLDRELLLKIAFNDLKKGGNKVTRSELSEYVDTTEGMIFTFWVIVRKLHPEVNTLERATYLFDLLGKEQHEEFKRKRDMASGTDELGNSTGPRVTTAGEKTPPSHGDASSSTSGPSTGSPPKKSGK